MIHVFQMFRAGNDISIYLKIYGVLYSDDDVTKFCFEGNCVWMINEIL